MELIKPTKSFVTEIQEIFQFRSLIYFLAIRNIKVKYRQTLIGVLWTILQPIIIMSVFVFFFSKTLELSTDEIPPPLFYLFGLVIWNYFSSAITNSSNSIVHNAELIKRIYFPRIILPLSNILMAVLDFIINLGLLLLLSLIYVIFFDAQINFLVLFINIILGFGIASITAVGLGIALSSLSVFYRDFLFLVPFGLQFLFFTSPIIYATSTIENPLFSKLLALNPLVGAIEIARSSLNSVSLSSNIWISISSSMLILIVGLAIYFKTEKHFADVV